MSGWIKLYRGINNWGWKTDPNVVALWVHLLTNANFENSYYLGYEIPTGSLPAGIPSLSLKTGLSGSQIRTAIKKLKMTGEIAVRITPKFSIITIVKWDEYQANDRQDSRPIAGQSQADDNTIRIKELKNIRNKNLLGANAPKQKTGFRLPDDWGLESDLGLWAMEQGMTREEVLREEEKFKNYWHAQTGAKARKLDWDKTFKNWIYNHLERKK